MPLRLVPPPPEVWDTYEKSLPDFMGPHPPEVDLYHLPVATLGLQDLQRGATLADVLPSGCRLIARWPDGSLTSCEMTNPTLYGLARFRNFVTGEPVAIPCARIAEAQHLDVMQTADYELRFLGIPSIYFEGLHLVHLGQGTDLILPVASIYPELPTDAVLQAAAFLDAARAIANARSAMSGDGDLSS